MARRFYIQSNNQFENNDIIKVDGEEFNHIALVLRHKVGDNITLINGDGNDYHCEILEINKKDLLLKVMDKTECKSEAKASLTVFQALVKGDKFELITQKLTELGVKKIVPFSSIFCQVKPNTTRLDRLEKISIEALKQCDRAKAVEIEQVKTFNQILEMLKGYDKVIFAYEKASLPLLKQDLVVNNTLAKNVAIVIGSEGGFSEEESKQISELINAKCISLGNRILRAETASISLSAIVMYLLDEMQ